MNLLHYFGSIREKEGAKHGFRCILNVFYWLGTKNLGLLGLEISVQICANELFFFLLDLIAL